MSTIPMRRRCRIIQQAHTVHKCCSCIRSYFRHTYAHASAMRAHTHQLERPYTFWFRRRRGSRDVLKYVHVTSSRSRSSRARGNS